MRHVPLLLAAFLSCLPVPDGDAGGDEDRVDGAPGPAESPVSAVESATPEAESPVSAAESREATERRATVLDRYDFARPAYRVDLPGRLDEISGLALSDDGRLFAHDDERARIHEIDPATGGVGKEFQLGYEAVREDFEGIALVGERFFLVSSRGRLYEFREGDDGEDVVYRVTDAGVGAGCEVEGLDYDASDHALLLACKRTDADPGFLAIHRLRVDPSAEPLPPLRVDRRGLAAVGIDEDFEASALVAMPGGSLLLVSAPQEALVEVDREGGVLGGVELSRDDHRQPEGLEVGPDGTLYIADEENDGDARLTAYTPRVEGGR